MAKEIKKTAKKVTKAPVKKETKVTVKKTTATKTVKPAAKVVKKETTAPKTVVHAGLKVDVLDTEGKVAGQVTLPEAVFGAKVNKALLAQAVRVYLVNQRQGNASTKTRGQVDGSTRKIYRQKGTGRARHGGVRAPIFVKGGIAHGPHPKEFALSLPKKMREAAFVSALSAKVQDGSIQVVTGVEKLDKKTKSFAQAFANWGWNSKKRDIMFVLPADTKEVYTAMRNLAGVTITTAPRLNTYEVLKHKMVILTKDAVEVFAKAHTK